MLDNNDREQIESYVRNEMPSGERLDFEALMASDADLRHQVEEFKFIAKGIRYAAQNDLRRMIENATATYHKTGKRGKPASIWWILGIILIVAGLGLLGYLFLWNTSQVEKENEDGIEISKEESHQGMASNSTGMLNDSLSMIGKEAFFSKTIQVKNEEGETVDENLTVSAYIDASLDRPHYLFHDQTLNLYFPEQIDFLTTTELIKKKGKHFINISNQEFQLIRGESLQLLGD